MLENKSKFFAQYLGQPVMRAMIKGDENNLTGTLNVDVNSETIKPNWFLDLTPLSMISDVDALYVLKIFGSQYSDLYIQFITKETDRGERFRQVYYNDPHKDGGDTGIDSITVYANFSDDGIHVLRSNRDTVYWYAIDYLRSKGYALPWMNISVEEQVKQGWVKLLKSK